MTDNICPGCGLENQGTELKCPSCVEHESVSQPSPRERITAAVERLARTCLVHPYGKDTVHAALAIIEDALDEIDADIKRLRKENAT